WGRKKPPAQGPEGLQGLQGRKSWSSCPCCPLGPLGPLRPFPQIHRVARPAAFWPAALDAKTRRRQALLERGIGVFGPHGKYPSGGEGVAGPPQRGGSPER